MQGGSRVKLFQTLPQSSQVIISVALMLFLGFAMTRLTKKLHLPNVTAYILCGILIGPYCLDLVPQRVIDGMDFLSDIALAFIAFSVGEFFRFSTLKKTGGKAAVITIFEACIASAFVFILTYYILHMDLAFSAVLAALASATAPASTMMTIRQLGARGDFVDTLLQVVAMDDVVSLVAYSAAISLALASLGAGVSVKTVALPILANLAVLALGGVFGLVLKLLLGNRSRDNRLIVSVAVLFAFCGICTTMDVSPLLGCMSMGIVYLNLTDDTDLFSQLNYFSPPILLLFFVRSGLNFKLDTLLHGAGGIGGTPLLLVGALYFLVRMAGKYVGAFVGCALVHKPKTTRNYLGMALAPQAGVAIGLAALGARTLGGATGDALQTIVLASSVLYELVGPALAKLSLYLSHSYSDKLEDVAPLAPDEPQKSEVELLIERIQKIQQELPAHAQPTQEEAAFTRAAREQENFYHGHLAGRR